MKNKIKNVLLILSIMAIVFLVPLISAAECAGQDCTLGTSITLNPTAPTITNVDVPLSNIVLTGLSTTNVVLINFTANASNGYETLGTGVVKLTKSGEATRTGTCTNTANDGLKKATYNCTVNLAFYDSAGSDWVVNVSVVDLENIMVEDTSKTITVAALSYVGQDITTMTWTSVTLGQTDAQAAAPLVLTNGGNTNFANVSVKAQNATGAAHSEVIPAYNFSVDDETGQTTEQTSLVENAYVQRVALSGLNSHGASVTENVFFYLDVPAILQADIYITSTAWSVKVSAT